MRILTKITTFCVVLSLMCVVASCGRSSSAPQTFGHPVPLPPFGRWAKIYTSPGGNPLGAFFYWESGDPVATQAAYAVVAWDTSKPDDVSPPVYAVEMGSAGVNHTYSLEGTYTVEVRWHKADGTFIRSFDLVLDLVVSMPKEIQVPFPD